MAKSDHQEIKRYQNLMRSISNDYAMAKGRLDQSISALKKEFNVTDIRSAKELLKVMEERLAVMQKEYDKKIKVLRERFTEFENE